MTGLAVIAAPLSCSEAWETPLLCLLPVLELLPACRSPHRSPDWSNRPWTPQPSGPRCGPEIGQTPNDRAPHHQDEPVITQGCGGWPWDPQHARRKWGHGEWRDRQTDIHGCLDNVDTHNLTCDHDGLVAFTHSTCQPFNTCMCLYKKTHLLLFMIMQFSQKQEVLHWKCKN